MATFARPESALKRAEEFIKVGEKQAALQTLHDVIISKRYQAWQKTLEQIMFKFVELCVDMRRDMFVKDGLIRYRIVCQKVNVSSLEEVITHFLHLSIEKAREAQKQTEGLKEALDVDDLEADKWPEDLMLFSVSGEKGRDRYDHELIMPWFKFLWKTYRIVIEVLRNNSNLEAIYSMTVQRAFQFCKQYKRTKEFHWLCEITRNHLSTVTKRGAQRDKPDLAPESLQLYLENQFEQLKIATELALWKEAFRSVEDIYGLMRIIKKSPKATLMIIYYAKLADILWVAESHLYHAYAWFKIFTHQKNCYKNISQKDLQLIASSTLLAALSVVPYDHLSGASQMELEKEKECNLRMARLISFTVDSKREKKEPFSRSSLLSELVSSGVYSCALQEVKDLYNLLEHEFLPLDLGSKVQPLLTKISKFGGNFASASSLPEVQLSKYVPALERLATLRLLQQVSQVYSTMRIGMLSRMIPFYDFSFVEKISVDAVKCNFIALKINHLKGVIFFGNIHLESDIWLNHSSVLAESLNKSRSLIYPLLKKPSKLGVSLHALAVLVDKEHKRLLARKLIIEKRKEEQERQLLEKEREGELKRLKIEKMMEEAEQKRLASEYLRREEQRIRRQIEERELEQHKTLLQDAEKRRKKGEKPVVEGDTVTKESLFVLALRKQLKQRQEMEKKLQKLAKTMDYLEKAKREKEAPLIEAAFQKHLMEEEKLHEHVQEQEIMLSWLCHSKNLEEKRRLTRMVANKMIFQNRVAARQYTERNEKIKREREIKRKLLFYLRCEEEEQKRLWEQEEARKREEAARKKKEDAERRAKLDESAEKQRVHLREIEEREAQLGKFGLPTEPPISTHPPKTVSTAPTLGKYVPPVLRREGSIHTGAAPTLEPDRRTRSDGRESSQVDRRVSHDRRAALGTIGSGRSSKWSAPKISEW